MSLLAPFFLLGLGMIALPLWLHRLQTQTPEREPFSSAMLLEASEQRLHMRRKLRFLLLLASRILLLVLLALAFAKPVLESSRPVTAGSQAALNLIVIDTSFSMGRDGRLAAAKNIARSIIDNMQAGQQAQIITADNHVRVIGKPGSDSGRLQNSLSAIQVGTTRLDFGVLMSNLNSLLDNYKFNVAIHLISDFQASGLPPRFADLIPKPANNQRVALYLHPLADSQPDNWAVVSAAPDNTGLQVAVHGYQTVKQQKTLTLRVNGVVQGRQTGTVPASGQAQFKFPRPTLANGDNRIEIAMTPGDDLPGDDRRFLVLENSPPRPVLLLTANKTSRAVTYLKTALETGKYKVEAVNPADLDPRILQRYPWVIIDDLGAINKTLSGTLADYLKAGGSIFAALGELSQGLNTLPVLNRPVKAVRQPGSAQFLTVARIDTSHPVLAKSPGWRDVNISRVMVPEPDAKDRVLITLAGGDPLLIERRVGSGRMLLLTTGLNNNWSDLPVHSVFVSFMAETARYLTHEDSLDRRHTAGDTILLKQAGGASGQVINPAGNKVLTLADTHTTQNVELDQTGFYQVYTPGRQTLIAVNPDPRESDTTPISADLLTRWRTAVSPQTAGHTAGLGNGIEPVKTELWRGLLLLLVLIVLTESILGNRTLGYRTGQ